MSRKLNLNDLKCLAYGATFMGSGGGGKLDTGLIMLERIDQDGFDSIQMVDVSDMGDGYAVPVFMMGASADVEDDDDFRNQIKGAGQAMKDCLKDKGKNLEYIISGELGGENTIVGVYAAIALGLPLIDADCQGRAVPELGTSLLKINSVPATPLVMAAGESQVDKIIAYPADPFNNDGLEKLARSICVSYGGAAAMATWPLKKKDIIDKLLPGQMTRSIEIGRLILDAKERGLDVVEEIKDNVDCQELVTGLVEKVELEVDGGFERGRITLAGEKGRFLVYFKNESLMVKNQEGQTIALAPDLINMIEVKDYKPLTNADIQEGMEVACFIMEAPSHWKKTKEALGVWDSILENMG